MGRTATDSPHMDPRPREGFEGGADAPVFALWETSSRSCASAVSQSSKSRPCVQPREAKIRYARWAIASWPITGRCAVAVRRRSIFSTSLAELNEAKGHCV